MIKFIVLLTSAITFNFTLSFGEHLGLASSLDTKEIQLEFSENPIGFESGQPVYPVKTKVIVKSQKERDFTITINGGKEIKRLSTQVDISNYMMPHADTYTIEVEAKAGEETKHQIFGFTTK